MENLGFILPEGKQVIKKKKPFRVIGIDLGTTNSEVVEIKWDPKESKILFVKPIEIEQETLEGLYTHIIVPSAVAIYEDRIFIGEGAKRLRNLASEIGLVRNRNLFYECKNDIGISKTYSNAPEGFRSAAEIGGKVLDFLFKSSLSEDPTEIERVVITVPASFQSAQRNDTVNAAKLAGITISGGDLLDEPVAAFLDYLLKNNVDFLKKLNKKKNILIFDFGGGTCDVAIFNLSKFQNKFPIQIAPMAVSRYHRLGGGDIDRAILHKVLIPQLTAQNNISERDLSYEDKKNYIEQSFIGLAEALKIGLCSEISRLHGFGKYETENKSKIIKIQPGTYTCKTSEMTLTIKNPQLSAEQFEEVMEDFLDKDFLYARDTEYYMTMSIFAPIQDALDRSDLSSSDIDFCLLVGGSCLIPQVVKAVSEFLPTAELLAYEDKESLQLAVAQGAAYHALSLSLYGKGLIQPMCNESISIKTDSGLLELVHKGVKLPYPITEDYFESRELAIPETIISGSLPLKLELVSGNEPDERLIYKTKWNIPAPLSKGDPIVLEYKYDENQVFDMKLRLKNTGKTFKAQIENPITNVVNPQSTKEEIAELEEDLRTGKVEKTQIPEKLIELADKYSELRQSEKAIDILKSALRIKGKPDSFILNKIGILYGEIEDYEKQEKYYLEAAELSIWGGPLFNLALSQRQRGEFSKAIENVEKAIKREPDEAPYFVLRAMLAQDINNISDKKNYLNKAFDLFKPLELLNDWELGWYITALNMAGETKKSKMAEEERRKRSSSKNFDQSETGLYPSISSFIKRRS